MTSEPTGPQQPHAASGGMETAIQRGPSRLKRCWMILGPGLTGGASSNDRALMGRRANHPLVNVLGWATAGATAAAAAGLTVMWLR